LQRPSDLQAGKKTSSRKREPLHLKKNKLNSYTLCSCEFNRPVLGVMKKILFLDKIFLERKLKLLCGVEIFNLCLLRDLASLGYSVAVPAHSEWGRVIRAWTGNAPVEIIDLPFNTGNMPGGLLALKKIRERRFDLLLLGNVGNSLIPMIFLLHWLRVINRIALIAHREPKPGFIRALKSLPMTVLAVNKNIAAAFAHKNFTLMKNRYGIAQSEQFYPSPPANGNPKPWVDFCVLGHLDRKWKGADTAEAAFWALPDDVRKTCRLHLAGFSSVKPFPPKNIIPYGWVPFQQIGNLLRGMDVMLVPSRDENNVMKETFSQASVQGMLTGLPLIVNNLPVLAEKVGSGEGFVFNDVEDLTIAMRRLAEDKQRRLEMGEQGRRTALKKYVWNTQNFVNELLGR